MHEFYKKNIDYLISQYKETENKRYLVYAILELRMLIENIANKILQQYTSVLNGGDENIWQPPQIIKLLSQYEEHIDKPFTFKMSLDNSHQKPFFIGEYKPLPKGRKLSTLYNSLGSYLHDQKNNNVEKITLEKFNEKFLQIEDIINNEKQMYCRLTEHINFTCGNCKTKNTFTEYYLKNNKYINCQNSTCNMLMQIKKEEKYEFRPAIIYNCECGEELFINTKIENVNLGMRITCKACKNVFGVSSFNMQKLKEDN